MVAASVAAGGGIVRAKFGNTEVSAIATALDSNVSQHTGKRLRRFRLVFRAYETKQKESIKDAAHSGTRVHLGPDGGSEETTWILDDHSYNYRDDEPMVTYSWTIAEEEHLQIDHLAIGDASFRPYRYEEEFDGSDTLTIYAHMRVSTDEWKALRAMSPYFSVVRRGINETPRKMRFGWVLWSTTEDADSFNLRVVLVDQHRDELHPKSHGFLEPFRSNSEILSAENFALTERLLEALISKGVFDRAEIDSLREEAEKDIPNRRLDFDRVPDVDEW
jgi:hypothetical protein